MNIEVIINLAIILFVVFSVLKRVREVSKKAQSLQGEPDGTPTDIPPSERQVETRSEYSEPAMPEGPAIPETRRRVMNEKKQDGVPPILRKFLEEFEVIPREQEMGHPIQLDEEDFNELEPVERKKPDMVRKPTPSKKRYKERVPEMVLGIEFSRNDLVRGIVMREILGPPVALREQDMG